MAIASLICAFVFAPLAILFGHISLSQIKRSGQDGHGLAIAGLVLGYAFTVLGVVVIVVTIIWTVAVFEAVDQRFRDRYYPTDDPSAPAFPTGPAQPLPTFTPPATLGSNCQYPATTEPASKPVTPPQTGRISTTPPIVDATIVTNGGAIGLQLDNAKAPCTVNNFTSLARQHYFDGTPCHRLTTSDSLGVLQCGDPTGAGSGGPGYRFPNEYPTNQYRLTDPRMGQPVEYPRGTLAMANSGPGTNGSQFFLVYKDSMLPPTYTVFGTIDAAGLAVVDKVAAGGVQGGTDDGKPTTSVNIQSVTVK
jgi:peptidyl-prolyl cis-trans isomerase B (cyclophilin B)